MPHPHPVPVTDEGAPRLTADGRLSKRALSDWLLVGAVASLIVCYSITTQSVTLGSPAGGWVYGYVQPFDVRALSVSLLAIALAAGLLFGVDPGTTRRDWPVVLAWLVLALGLQGLMRSVTPVTFERIFASEGANSFYSATQYFPARLVLADFDRVRALLPLHAQSNMPGKLMLVYALRNLTRDPGALAWLTVVVSNAGAIFTYLFAHELFADRRIAIYSAVLYLLVPAKLYFFPILNTVTPIVVLACAWLVLRWLRTGRVVDAAALGIVLFGLVFFEPLPLVMGLLFALFVVRAVLVDQISWHRVATQAGVVVAAWLAVYAIVRAVFGFNLLSAFAQLGGHAVQFNVDAGRPYSIWIVQNLREFLFGIGVCQAVVFCAALVDGLRGRDGWREKLTRPITVLCIGTVAVVLATDLIGVNRGEVIRLWIFLACFLQIPAAYVCARLGTRAALMLVIALTVVQATLGTAMIGFVVL